MNEILTQPTLTSISACKPLQPPSVPPLDSFFFTIIRKGSWKIVSIKTPVTSSFCSFPFTDLIIREDGTFEYIFFIYDPFNKPEKEIEKIFKDILDLTLNINEIKVNSRLDNFAIFFSNLKINLEKKEAEAWLNIRIIQKPWVDKVIGSIKYEDSLALALSENIVALTKKFKYNTSLIPLIREFYAKLNFCSKHEMFFLFQELEKKKPRILEDSVEFFEINVQRLRFRKSRVNVKAAGGVLTCKIFLEAEREAFEYTSEVLENLKSYFKEINSKIQCGCFLVDEKERKIYYKVSFRASPLSSFHGSLYKLLAYYLKIYYLHTESLFAICNSHSKEIIQLSSDGKKLRLHNTTQTISKELDDEQLKSERKIRDEMLKEDKFLVLSNRFKPQEIEFSGNKAYYKVQLFSKSFESYVLDGYDEAMDSIDDLIGELTSYNLYFKNSRFPIESFAWLREIPVYTYDKPLCEILEFSLNPSQDYLKQIKKLLEKQLLSMLNAWFTSSYIPGESKSVTVACQDHSAAISRISLYRNNRYPFVKKYYGFTDRDGNWAMVCSKLFAVELEDYLLKITPAQIFEILREIAKVLHAIQAKNSLISAVDHTCFGLCRHNKLKMWVKSPEEIHEPYQAPEVLNGKSHKNSLSFSFAVIIEYCINSYQLRKFNESLGIGREFVFPKSFSEMCPELIEAHSRLLEGLPMKRMTLFKILEIFNRIKHYT